MKKPKINDKKRTTKKSQASSESKDKKSTLIKTTSDIERDLEIPSYDEFKIKDNDSLIDYQDEDIETKMIRLIFLKKKGENIKDKINLRKKSALKRNEYLTKMQRIKKAINILENLEIVRKKNLFFKYMNRKKISLVIKLAKNLIHKIKKYIFNVYVKNIYFFVFPKKKKEEKINNNMISIINKNKNRNLLLSPQSINPKTKKFKFPNKLVKLELMTKKNNMNKKGGVETILERMKNEKEKEKILGEKFKKLINIRKREKEYISRMNQKKKKLRQEIELFKKNNNISDDAISQIKQNNNISDRNSNFFSNDNSSKFGSFHLESSNQSEIVSRISRNRYPQKTSKNLKFTQIFKSSKKEIDKNMDIYSINSRKKNISESENDNFLLRNSVRNIRTNKRIQRTDKKNIRSSLKISGFNFKNKFSNPSFGTKNELKVDDKAIKSNKQININILNDSENLLKQENNSKKSEEKKSNSKIFIDKVDGEEEEELDYTDVEEDSEISDSNQDFNFIQIGKKRYDYAESPSFIKDEKVDLVEYDTLYKETFFKDDMFRFDAENLKDKEAEKIKKEINKLEIKQKLKEKRKLKEVNDLKGIDTNELKNEIQILDEKYKNMKKEVKKKLELNIETTDDFLRKGRILNFYFKRKKDKNFPRFSIESEEELGAKEIIDFKPLRKEELIRRYYDHCCCFKQRKKIHEFRIAMRFACKVFVDNIYFETLATVITFVNCVLFFFSDPSNPDDLWNNVDYYFLIFYIIEAILKINTFSFYSAEGAYIRDYWNWLDLLVVIIGVFSFILDNIVGSKKSNFTGLTGLKAFRILKFLKTMKRFKNLKKLTLALIASISRLWEILIILFFFFLFFAASGLQMWQGLFLRRCMNINYGYLMTDKRNSHLCSFDTDCTKLNDYGNKFICAKGYINPNSGSTNFDNIFYSLITVFIMVTLEGWTNIFTYVSKTFKDKAYINQIIIFIYFHAFIYIGAFYLINLFLAVTNSEFEHIERSRKELNMKKSFFELIKKSFDPTEKKKKERKETEKLLKSKNDKKSDEALKSLYYKIKEEAFHIHKNKRGVPKVYSTVKDIYIMANNNPEELYSEKLRIRNEEKKLCKDVKIHQKEIELLLKKNKLELDKSKISTNKINKTKTIINAITKDENKNDNKKLNYNATLKQTMNIDNNNGTNKKINESTKDQKINKTLTQNIKNDLSIGNISADLSNILYLKNNIKAPLIEIAKDKTDKYFYDKRNNKIKSFEKFKDEKKIKKPETTKRENHNNNQISFFEDIKVEKRKKELEELKTHKLLISLKARKQISPKVINDRTKENNNKKFDIFFRNRSSIKKNLMNDRVQLNTQLSCINDLMLSSLSENSENEEKYKKTKSAKKNIFTHIHSKKNMKLTKLLIHDFRSNNNLDNLSFENEVFNNALFNNTKRKSKNSRDTSFDKINEAIINEEKNDKSIINAKQLLIFDDIYIKSNFERPHSTLNNIIKSDKEQKYKEENIKFNLKKYLKKEAEKDKEFLNKDRRKSFLGFLEYAQYQKEQNELENLIEKDNEQISSFSDSNYNNENSLFVDNSLHFLDEESFLSRNDTFSVDDIDLLPNKFYENKIYHNDYLLHENLKRNLDSNKLTQKIRAEVFDRQSVNTNVNLKNKELKKYYEEINKKLDEQLYVNKKKIRIRDDKTNCNLSGIIKYSNYNNNLKAIRRDEENDTNDEENEEEEKIKNNFLNNINTYNNNETKKNPNFNLQFNDIKNYNSNNHITRLTFGKLIPVNVSPSQSKKLINRSPRRRTLLDREIRDSPYSINARSSQKVADLKDEDKNSGFPLLINQKSLKVLNLLGKNGKNSLRKESEGGNGVSIKTIPFKKLKSQSTIKNETQADNQKNNINETIINSIVKKNNDKVFYFKAKSIDKNIKKYPKENSKKYIVEEENKKSKELLTTEQELIPVNLRGKKYYMNYLYNIMDIDLCVKDNFKVNHWRDEVLNIKKNLIPLKHLPLRSDAFYVFNDKDLNLKKYRYIYYTDYKYKKNELTYITTKLKYLPLNILVLMPKKLINFGKYSSKQNYINMLKLNDHIELIPRVQSFENMRQNPLNFYPNSVLVSTIPNSNNPSEELRSVKSFSKLSNFTRKNTSKGTLAMSSAYTKNNVIQKEISFKKDIFDKIHKKMNDFNYMTLSHYFLDEDKLMSKFMDSRRQEELINNKKEENRKKYNRMIVKNEVENILLYDIKTKSHTYIKWSGEDVLYNKNIDLNKKNWNKLIQALEDFNMIIWHQNPYIKKAQKIRYAFYVFANNDYFEYTILSLVIINTVFSSLEGNLFRPEYLLNLSILNYGFNTIFIFEFIVKFIGLTPLVYYSDAFSILDTIIIACSIVDMAIPDENSDIRENQRSVNSQISFLRVFRIFRVVRIAKVLRKLKPMRIIIVSISKSMSNVGYIIIILICFIFIFQLLGMSLLYGNNHYKSFLEAFYTTYQILTLENWDSVFYDVWPINKFSILYFVLWIFIGNYILFNLFISILIQSFGDLDIEDEHDLTDDEKIERLYTLPDYLYKLKNNINDNNYVKIHEQRRVNKEPINNLFFSSNTYSNSKEDKSKYSTSNFNVSKITIEKDIDSDEELNLNDISRTEEINDELKTTYTNDKDKKYTTIEKRMMKWQKINAIFKRNNCEDSLFLFSQSNCFRILCMKLINHPLFDKFILFIIILSTARLIIDTFLGGYTIALFFDVCDTVFNIIFLLEAIMKIIALGFVFDDSSYLRDNWNKMDAIIVLCSFVDFHNTFQKYFKQNDSISSTEFLKLVRLLRTLRPLRFISHNDNLKLIITSLFDSIVPICSTLFILIIVLFIFSIVGISLFYPYLHNCYILKDDGQFELTRDSFSASYEADNSGISALDFCSKRYNGIMDTGPAFKFSNIIDAFITSYVLSSMEGWPDIMNSYRIYGDGFGLFFVVFNLIVAYFFLNLFTGIMFKYFNEAYKRQQKLDSDDKKTAKYYDFLTQIMDSESDYIIWKKPHKGTFQYYLRQIVDSEYFENTMLGIILFNFLLLCLSFENCPPKYTIFLKVNNKILTILFTIEFILKLSAYGFRPYFHVSWNRFDFFLVIISYVDWKFSDVEGIDSSFLKTFQLVRVLRVLRVSRVLRLIKALKGLEKLIQTLQWSISALSNVLFLTIVIYGTIALMGCYLYGGDKYIGKVSETYYINDYFNFMNFYSSYLLIFRCSTGENWHNIMGEYAYKDNSEMGYSFVFFILDNFITSVILLNLLLMVTLQQYDEFTDKKYNPIEKFNSFIKDFNSAWNKYSTDEEDGYRIKKYLAAHFLIELNSAKLVFPEKNKLEYAKKYVSDLKLYYDKEDYIYYHDVIFKLLYKLYGTRIDRENPDNNLIFKTEKKILKQIRNNINEYIIKKKGNNQKNTLITFNPLTSHLYYKFSFNYLKVFINYYKENEQFLQHIKENISPKKGETQNEDENPEKSDSNNNEEEDENEEEESDENEEGESLNNKESKESNESKESKSNEDKSSYALPDGNNLYGLYKNKKNKNSENKTDNEENGQSI